MAQIQFNLTGQGGLAPRFFGDKNSDTDVPNRRYIGGDTQYADGVINPLAIFGYLIPGGSDFLTTLTPGVNDYIISTLVDGQTGSIYFLENNHILYCLNKQSDTTLNTLVTLVDLPDPAQGADPGTRRGTDLEKYTLNGQRKIFFSYRDNLTGEIGTMNFTGSLHELNWFSSFCNGGASLAAVDHKMISADNGYMYILDGNAIHKVDGTTAGGANGTATLNAVTFPVQTFRLVDGVDSRSKMWIGLVQNTTTGISSYSYTEQVGVYIWDRLTTQVSMTDYIPIDGAMDLKAMFSYEGVVGCFTIGNDFFTQLRLWNGNTFEIVEELGRDAFPRFPDSVAKIPTGILWLSSDGYLYFYGRIAPGQNNSLHKIGYIFQGLSTGNAGAIVICGTGTILSTFISQYGGGGGNRIRKMLPNSTSRYPINKEFWTLTKPLPKLSTTKGITLYHLPITSGTSTTIDALVVDVYFNQSTSTIATFHISQAQGAKSFQYLPIAQRNVNWVQLGIKWNSATTIAQNLWPIYATLDYEDTPKKL